jgi:tight adherence protein C
MAWADGLEISEVRAENYPRLIVRFSAHEADGTPISNIKLGQLQVWENDNPQEGVDFYSLRESSPELWISLVIDVSGSMNDDNKLSQAKEAAKAFISRLRPKDRTSIVSFSDRVVLHQQPTGDTGVLRRAIDSLQAKGPTRMNDGLARGVAEVMRARPNARRAVILLSDGEDTDSQTTLREAIGPALEARLPIFTIGFGPDVKADILQGVANETKARYYGAPTGRDLDYAFKLLSGQLSSQYEVWWPSNGGAPVGSTVQGRLRLERGAESLETSFSYVVPALSRAPVRPERAVETGSRSIEVPIASLMEFPDWWPLAAAVLGALGTLAAYYGVICRLTRSRLQQRLQQYVGGDQSVALRLMRAKSPQRQAARPIILRMARLSHRLMPSRVLDHLRQRLVLAGRPSAWHFSQFLATKLLLAIGLGAAGFGLMTASSANPTSHLAMVGSLSLLGFYLPHPWLGAQIRSRQRQIQRALPDALDLMTVGVGAGLSLDGAILEVVEKSDNALTQELINFLAELRMGRSRREALQGLAARTEVEDVKVLVASLVQAEELGMSLSDALTVQADQMRIRRRQRAEELAHKATLKMMFPMIILIFPALFVVIMGPAVPGLARFMGG